MVCLNRITIILLTESCKGPEGAGPHFNPTGAKHGGLNSKERHLGDLGDILADEAGVADIEIEDANIKLAGPYTVIGCVLRKE